MSLTYEQRLERNIWKYSWYKIFTKRVYLPLIAIQLVNVGAVTLEQIALIAAASAILSLILELPTGYLADKLGSKVAIVTGAAIMASSSLFYILMPNFAGGLLASLLFFGGYSFQSGAIEAFIHDTLVALKRDHEYAKVMGRAQSYGLIGNVILLIAIPATYTINHALPFILGTAFTSMLVWLGLSFTYPERHNASTSPPNPVKAIRQIATRNNLPLFLFAGTMLGVSVTSGNYCELVWQHADIAVGVFGSLVAVSSIIGAILGRHLHVLDRLKPGAFYLYDVLFFAGFLMLAGATTNPAVVICAFIILLGYDRVHYIVFQAKLLKDLQHAYKATLISALNVFATLGQLIAALLFGTLVGQWHYGLGHVLFGLCVLAVGLILWLFVTSASRRIPVAETADTKHARQPAIS